MARERRIKKPQGQTEQWRTKKKRMRGEGVFYAEPKSETVKLSLTPAGKAKLQFWAAVNQLSMSEYIERWLPGESDGLTLPFSGKTGASQFCTLVILKIPETHLVKLLLFRMIVLRDLDALGKLGKSDGLTLPE